MVALSTSGECSVDGDLEGKFASSTQMGSYLECVLPGLVQWHGSVYAQMPPPTTFYFVPSGFTGKDGGCALDDEALKYCKASRTVYLGEAAVWDQYTRFGDAFMAYARAQGWLNVEDDIVDLAGSLQAAGETEGPRRTRGTIDERLAAFDKAYLSQAGQPMSECVAFVPEVPILN